MTTALVTGASSGIGAAFARELTALGHDLVVVARDTERLGKLAAELSGQHGRNIEVLAADLTDFAQRAAVEARLADPDRPIDLLINNAGIALGRRFIRTTIEDQERLLDLHVRATMRLTHAALPGMIERGHGAIVNVSSIAGYVPQGSYNAAKAWVTLFSESLANETRRHGLRVMAVLPGFVRTELHERAGIRISGTPGVLWLTPEQVVRGALQDLKRGKVISVPTARYKVLAAFARTAPRRLVAAAVRR